MEHTLCGPTRRAVGAHGLIELGHGLLSFVTMGLALDGDKSQPGTQVIPCPESSWPWPWGPLIWVSFPCPALVFYFPEPMWIWSPSIAQPGLFCTVSHREEEGLTTPLPQTGDCAPPSRRNSKTHDPNPDP